jgi:hypothetical protein
MVVGLERHRHDFFIPHVYPLHTQLDKVILNIGIAEALGSVLGKAF